MKPTPSRQKPYWDWQGLGLVGVQGKSSKEFLTWGETQETRVSFRYSLAIDFGKSSSSLDLDFPTCKMA